MHGHPSARPNKCAQAPLFYIYIYDFLLIITSTLLNSLNLKREKERESVDVVGL